MVHLEVDSGDEEKEDQHPLKIFRTIIDMVIIRQGEEVEEDTGEEVEVTMWIMIIQDITRKPEVLVNPNSLARILLKISVQEEHLVVLTTCRTVKV